MLKDIKIILYIAKICGCFPLKIIGNSLILTKLEIIYSFFFTFTVAFLRGYFMINHLSLNYTFRDYYEMAFFIFILTGYTWDTICMILKKKQLELALSYLYKYDVASKFNKKKCYSTFVCKIFIGITIFWWIVIIFIENFGKYYNTSRIIWHTLLYGTTWIQVYKFCCIMCLLYDRIDHSNKLVQKNGKYLEQKKIKLYISI